MFECSQEIFTWYMQGKSQITFPLVEEITEATWGHGDAKSSACGLHASRKIYDSSLIEKRWAQSKLSLIGQY